MRKNEGENSLERCRLLIEQKLCWGNSADWTNYDFEKLSDEINLATSVRLSVTTLKRIWGKLKYDSAPTITTLNTLARFAGHTDWRTFVQLYENKTSEEPRPPLQEAVPVRKFPVRRFLPWLLFLVIVAAAYKLTLTTGTKPDSADVSAFSFRANKILTEGVPNSVVFHYDARCRQDRLCIHCPDLGYQA